MSTQQLTTKHPIRTFNWYQLTASPIIIGLFFMGLHVLQSRLDWTRHNISAVAGLTTCLVIIIIAKILARLGNKYVQLVVGVSIQAFLVLFVYLMIASGQWAVCVFPIGAGAGVHMELVDMLRKINGTNGIAPRDYNRSILLQIPIMLVLMAVVMIIVLK